MSIAFSDGDSDTGTDSIPLPSRDSVEFGLSQALQLDDREQSIRRWQDLLARSQFADAFEPLRETPEGRWTLGMPGFGSLRDWLVGARTWERALADPQRAIRATYEERVLLSAWQDFSEKVRDAVQRARDFHETVPTSGGILAFVAGVETCLALKFTVEGARVDLEVVAAIDNPGSVFDFWGSVELATPSVRNQLRSLISSGHKLVYHRGVLAHVDRRAESEVFGPSIDTLVMAELLAKTIYCRDRSQGGQSDVLSGQASILEVGSGSGFLTAGAADFLSHTRAGIGPGSVTAVDVEMPAVNCTHKNVSISGASPGGRAPTGVTLIRGEFNPRSFTRRFDLIICNPPYIPEPRSSAPEQTKNSSHRTAVSGTTLARDLVSNLGLLLAPGGRALVMTSSVSGDSIMSAVPPSYAVSRPLGAEGFRAVFDVEEVVNSPEWVSELSSSLEEVRVGEQVFYFHRLHPLWIQQAPETGGE